MLQSRTAAGPAGPSARPSAASRPSPLPQHRCRSGRPTPRTRAADSDNAPPPSATTPTGPTTPPPDYTALDARPTSRAVMALFRRRMVAQLGGADAPESGYDGIVALTRALNARPAAATRAATRAILLSLFPPGLPAAFAALFSRNLPLFSARLNALATAKACEWLMGECEVNDGGAAAAGAGAAAAGTGVLVKRCRYLEATGCVSACLNSCRRPTQDFFALDMGLPLTMTPDFETFECQFSWGVVPPDEGSDPLLAPPPACFPGCPVAAAGGGGGGGSGCACPGAAPQARAPA